MDDFNRRLEKPRAFAREVGAGLGEYLARALSHRTALAEPRDLAWLLASYARDGLARVEAAGDAPSLKAVRSALEDALGVRFEGEKGAAFFRSTLVQTLFYGLFSAWVLWARQLPPPKGDFNWHEAVWHLRAPVLRALFQQISDPGRLQPLGLVEVLDWTSTALDRVDREAFFARFNEGEAVPYFYEPFLEIFDPDLRKQLGVWYTPAEVVRYMVARVDRALKDDLGISDGLAAENVYVLDPCCGTGAYLAEVLRRIAVNLERQGLGALAGARVKQAALNRVFGFEIMPAPFVVAHLQVGLTMQDLDAPLAKDERPGVFLTNALTGWEPRTTKPLLSIVIISPGLYSRPGPPSSTCWRAWSAREGRLTPTYTKKKNGQRFRYYVSRCLIQHSGQKDLSGWRLPAPTLEQTVVQSVGPDRHQPQSFSLRNQRWIDFLRSTSLGCNEG